MNIRETAAWLGARDNFLILTHRRPDGDTLGCAAALAGALSGNGKTAFVLNNPETTPRYLPYVKPYLAPEGFTPDEVIAVDTASVGLFQVNASAYAGRVSLCIDHHPSNSGYAALLCCDTTRAACGEVVYDLLIQLYGEVSCAAATLLYIALSTDTGCFSFANTTANTLRVASYLVDAGAPQGALNRKLFRKKARSRISLEGMITSGLEFFYDGTVAVASVTARMMAQSGATENEMDDIASIPGGIADVLVGITIRELSGSHDCKVSVRTSPRVDASGICALFGGGGHAMAAGFSAEMTVEEIKRRLIPALADFLPQPVTKG